MRSGDYSAYAQVKAFDPTTVLTLSQTVNVLPGETVPVGFYVGHGQGQVLGSGTEDSKLTMIFIDGVPIWPNTGTIPGGTAPADFLQIAGTFNTGTRTSVTVAFQMDGSGTEYAINSFDDFYLMSNAAVPEPSTYIAGALMVLPFGASALRMLRKKTHTA